LESSLDVQSFFDAFYVSSQISEIKDDIQVVSQFPCLFPVQFNNIERIYKMSFSKTSDNGMLQIFSFLIE